MVNGNSLTLTFTGHRPDKLAGYERDAYRDFTDSLSELLYEEYYTNGYRKFITGGAQGFDQLAFWAVEKMRRTHQLPDVENVVYIPFEGQERRWKSEGTFSQADYKKMRRMSDKSVVLIPYASSRGEVVAALMSRNRDMVDASDRVLALCNSDTWETDSGGTAACMQYAKIKKKRPVDRITTALDDRKLSIASFTQDI